MDLHLIHLAQLLDSLQWEIAPLHPSITKG